MLFKACVLDKQGSPYLAQLLPLIELNPEGGGVGWWLGYGEEDGVPDRFIPVPWLD